MTPSLERREPSGEGSGVGPAEQVDAPHLRRTPLLDAALDKAVTIPSATIHAHVQSLRRRNPHASPQQIIWLLEREYMRVVQGTGAAVGVAAAAPAIGTGVAMALTASDVGTFFATSAAFSLAVASVHGIDVQDAERRRALLLATVLGESGAKAVADSAQIGSVHFARTLLTRMPTSTIRKVNSTLTRRLIRTQAARQSGLAFGRLLPFGIGAAVGIAGARALGKPVVQGARIAFGPAPERFPQVVEGVGGIVQPSQITPEGEAGPDPR